MDEAPNYTPESANAVLPEVRLRMEGLQHAYPLTQQMRAASAGNGGGPQTEEWKEAVGLLTQILEWFSDAGIIVRDIEQGLIEFPSIRNGEEVHLCWKVGEPSVDFWHYPGAGFAGRQPI